MSTFPTVLGALGLLSCVASLIALHFLPTGYHPIPDAVSNYAVSRYGSLYGLQAFSSGISGLCLLGLIAAPGAAMPLGGLVALGCYGLSRLLIVGFPTDVHPPRTRKGTLHAILASFTFAGIAFAAGMLTSSLASLPTWSGAGAELHAAAWLTDGATLVFLVVASIPALRPILGLAERLIYLGTLLWLGILFAELLLAL